MDITESMIRKQPEVSGLGPDIYQAPCGTTGCEGVREYTRVHRSYGKFTYGTEGPQEDWELGPDRFEVFCTLQCNPPHTLARFVVEDSHRG